MALTLWRGEQLLGELRIRPTTPNPHSTRRDRPPTMLAYLIPSAESPVLNGVWQLESIFTASVVQGPIEPDIVAERSRRAPRPGSGALEPVSPDAIVPVEMQLKVRDEGGRLFLPRRIYLEEVRYGPEDLDVARREAPPEVLVNGSVWSALVVFASHSDAPIM